MICHIFFLLEIHRHDNEKTKSHEKFFHHLKTFELRKTRNVEPVIGHHHLGAAVALVTRETEETHRLVVHAHELSERGRFCRLEKVGMEGQLDGEEPFAKVEIVAGAVVVKIGKEADEAREAHHEHEMEVGVGPFGPVEPQDAVFHVGEEWLIFLFFARTII